MDVMTDSQSSAPEASDGQPVVPKAAGQMAPAAEPPVRKPLVYNLGAGARRVLKDLPPDHPLSGWGEVSVDLNPASRPDIVADLTDLSGKVADGAADLVILSHVIEHFFDHQVDAVLREVARILHKEGAAIFKCPDLAQVAKLIVEHDLERDIYVSPAGPIRVLDVLYGHRASVARGDVLMAHKTGFTENSLADRLLGAGFAEVRSVKGPSVDFHCVATLGETPHKSQINALLKL
jgi:SAM-dependent methyltransferase